MTPPDTPKRQPYWLWQTKRLFPHPLFAGCISVASLLAGILLAGLALSVPVWPIGIGSLVLFAVAFAAAAAAVTGSSDERSATEAYSGYTQTDKPTFAIFVLLIGVYSWLLTLAIHVFDTFFKNGPGSAKYYLTLGIAITSTLFMQVYGKRAVRQHFGAKGGRNLELTGWQALYVIAFVVSCGSYLAWIVYG